MPGLGNFPSDPAVLAKRQALMAAALAARGGQTLPGPRLDQMPPPPVMAGYGVGREFKAPGKYGFRGQPLWGMLSRLGARETVQDWQSQMGK